MPKLNNNLINKISEDLQHEKHIETEHKNLYEEMFWDDKMWEERWESRWDAKYYEDYVKDTKNDLKQIKQSLFQMQSLLNLIENDINNMEDKNNAIS